METAENEKEYAKLFFKQLEWARAGIKSTGCPGWMVGLGR
jgi:hypothetical protein